VCEDEVAAEKSILDVKELEQSLVSLQLRQENNRLQQAVDVLTRAHAQLSDDLNLKNTEIAQLEIDCGSLKLQVAELSEKAKLTELELFECKKGSSCCAELSAEYVVLKDRISAANNNVTTLHSELESYANSLQLKQIEVDDLQELLSVECSKTQLLSKQLVEEQNKLASEQTAVTEVSTKNSDLTAKNADLQNRLELAEKECSNLQLLFDELCRTTDSADRELQHQMQCLQNDYHLNLQSLKVSEEKCAALQLQHEQLTNENSSLALQLLDANKNQAEMQAKVNELEQALQDNVKVLTESKKVAGEYLNEKAAMQEKLADAEHERDSLCIRVNEFAVQYQSIEKSLQEAQERLVQCDQQLGTADGDFDFVRQQMALFRQILGSLQQQLKQEESEKIARKQQVMKLKVEIVNLKESIKTQKGTTADVLKAKEETDKQTALLQLLAENLTSEKVTLEQQVRILEESNSSLKKDLLMLTDNYENAKKHNTELQLHVDEVCAHEQNLCEQLSLLRLLCEQKDEMIKQVSSEMEKLSCSLADSTQKADTAAEELMAHNRRIGELEEQNTVVEERIEKLYAEKQMFVVELNTCKDVIEQQKQSIADAKHENEYCQKVISDYEEQSLHWKDGKRILEDRIAELENCIASKDKEVQAMLKRQEVERISIDNFLCVKNFESMDVSNRDVHRKCELIENVDGGVQKAEMEKNICSDSLSVHNPCSEPDGRNFRECQTEATYEQSITEKHDLSCVFSKNKQESNLQTEADRSHINQKVNLQPVMSEDAATCQNENSVAAVKRTSEIVDAADTLSKNVAEDSAWLDWNELPKPFVTIGFENSFAVSVIGVNNGRANKEPLDVENAASSNETVVQATRDHDNAVVDAANKQDDLDMQYGGKKRHRKVIKRFTRLSQAPSGLKHIIKPLGQSVCGTAGPNLCTQAACSLDVNVSSVANDIMQQLDSKGSVSLEASSSSVTTGIKCIVNLQDSSSNIAAPISAIGTTADDTTSVDVCPAAKAVGQKHLSLCEQLAGEQAVSQPSQHDKETRNRGLNTPEYPLIQSMFVNNYNNFDNKPDPPATKRQSTDVNGADAKKLCSG